MGAVEWGALCTLAGFLLTFAAFVAKVASRLTKAESAAAASIVTQTATDVRISDMERGFSAHREMVAREYASREALLVMEDRLIAALNRLGDRLDALFTKVSNNS